jgi:hypothetical protein
MEKDEGQDAKELFSPAKDKKYYENDRIIAKENQERRFDKLQYENSFWISL